MPKCHDPVSPPKSTRKCKACDKILNSYNTKEHCHVCARHVSDLSISDLRRVDGRIEVSSEL